MFNARITLFRVGTLGKFRIKIVVVFLLMLAFVPIFASSSTTVTAEPQEPFFSLVLGCPDTNPDRILWNEMIAESFAEANIDVQIHVDNFGFWWSRVFYPSEEVIGSTFADGGWDTLCLGINTWSNPDPYWNLHSESLPPIGLNYLLWEDEINDALIEEIANEADETIRNQLIRDWQQYIIEETPSAILHYPKDIWVYDPNLNNLEDCTYIFQIQAGDPQIRFPAGGGDLIVAQLGNPENLNPIFTGSIYDRRAINPTYEHLFTYANNDASFAHELTPTLAAAPYDVSEDGCIWTIYLRDDIYWPTGFRFNASDLYLTYQAAMDPVIGFPYESANFRAMGVDINDFEIIDEFTLRVTLPQPNFWAKLYLNVCPISYVAMKDIPFEDWREHPSNRGGLWTTLANYGGTYIHDYDVYGPLGLGPYVCHEPDTGMDWENQIFRTRRRDLVTDPTNPDPGYFMGSTGFGITDMPETYAALTIPSAEEAIAALEAGNVNLIANYLLQNHLDWIDSSWGTIFIEPHPGYQEVGFNMRHPILGTGEATPLGQTDPSRATEAARYVRQALNHLIPRQQIIDEILNGYGTPGITPIHPLLPAFDSSLSPYEYNPERAAELLAKAGYILPRRGQLQVSGSFDFLEKEEILFQIAALLTDFETGEPISGAVLSATLYGPDGAEWNRFSLTETIPEPGLYTYTSDLTLKDLKWPKGIYLVYVHAIILKEGWVQGETYEMIQFHIDPPGDPLPPDVFELWLAALGVIGLASVVIHGFLVLFWLRRRQPEAP